MTVLALPTRSDEAFRYADLAALEPLWPLATQEIRVAAGEESALALVLDGTTADARDLSIVLEDGASFDLRVLNAGSAYGRIAVSVTLGKAAKFHLGAALSAPMARNRSAPCCLIAPPPPMRGPSLKSTPMM